MKSRRTLAALVVALVAVGALAWWAVPTSTATRYDRLRLGMTRDQAGAAMGGPGTAERGDTTGKFMAKRSEGKAPAAAGERRYWVFGDGAVIADFAGDGTLAQKSLLQ